MKNHRKMLLLLTLLPAALPLAAEARPVAQQLLVADKIPQSDERVEQLRQRVAAAEVSSRLDAATVDSTTARRAARRLERTGHPVD